MAKIIDNQGAPVGMSRSWIGLTAPDGWLFEDGRTIGNVSSGATALASADCFDLFKKIWDSYPTSTLVIQTNAGASTTKGVSALADWNALCRIGLPDSRGRVRAGKDDMGGVAASRLTGYRQGVNGALLGASGGEQSHLADPGEMPAHSHSGFVAAHPQHQHYIGLGWDSNANFQIRNNGIAGGGGVGNPPYGDRVVSVPAFYSQGASGSTITKTNFPGWAFGTGPSPGVREAASSTPLISGQIALPTAGNSEALNVVQPTLITNFIIKL